VEDEPEGDGDLERADNEGDVPEGDSSLAASTKEEGEESKELRNARVSIPKDDDAEEEKNQHKVEERPQTNSAEPARGENKAKRQENRRRRHKQADTATTTAVAASLATIAENQKETIAAATSRTKRRGKKAPPPAPPPVTSKEGGKAKEKNERDAKLRHLGQMSPKEQVDKYLQSVDKARESYQKRSAGDAGASEHHQPHPMTLGLRRELNGPRSFASLSQLDHIQPSKPPKAKPAANMRETGAGRNHCRDAEYRKKRSLSNLDLRTKSIDPPSSRIVSAPSSAARTSVVYLGRIPLAGHASDLSALQLPLKELYFNYMSSAAGASSSGECPPASTLEIAETGLKIKYVRERQKGMQEVFNPFPTIAVWAAVRFIYKREMVAAAGEGVANKSRFLYAFLPLISDPGDAEREQVRQIDDIHIMIQLTYILYVRTITCSCSTR